MERITIEVGDDGRITVMAESPGEEGEEMETMEFDNIDDAMQAVQGLVMDEQMDQEEGMGMEAEEGDMESMWNEEVTKRPKNPNMMR